MGPKKNRGKGGGGDKQGQPQQGQQPNPASQQQGAAGSQQQARPQQPQKQAWGQGGQQQQQQQQPQGAGGSQQQARPQQPQKQAWGQGGQQQQPQGAVRGPQQRQDPQQPQQQGQGSQQGPPQAAAAAPIPPPSVWNKPQSAPGGNRSLSEIETGIRRVEVTSTSKEPSPAPVTIKETPKQPEEQPGKGKGRGRGQKPKQDRPQTAPGPGQASTSGEQAAAPSAQGAGAPKPEQKIGDGQDMELVISPRKTINQKDKPGKRIRVETNHLAISFKKQNVIAYHYDVSFEPDKPKYLIRPAWKVFAEKFFKNRFPSFDGKKNVYSNGPLPEVGNGVMEETIQVYNSENDKMKEFKIKIQYAAQIDLSALFTYVGANDERGTRVPRDALQAVDVVLRNLPANQLVQSGRLFFSPPAGRVFNLGEGLDLWYGFHQSAILGWKPYLNVDIAHKGFPTPSNLLDTLKIVCEWDGRSPLDRWQTETFRKYIKRLKVEYKIPNLPSSKRVYKVNDVVGEAQNLKFKLDNGQDITVAAYYERERNWKLNHPYLPCLWVGSVSGARKIYIATELCKVVEGQVVNGKMSENQTANMVKEAAKGTDIRKGRIMEQIKHAKYSNSPFANEFGISVAGEFEQVEARVLPAPQLSYFQNRTENPRAGVWRAASFENPAQLAGWCVLCLDGRTREDSLFNLEDMLLRSARDLGMNPLKSNQPPRKLTPRDDLEQVFKDLLAKNIRIVFVVVPDKGPDNVYARVKKVSELRVGILTQCIKAFTVFKKLNGATISNILLKVNAKLNGVNHVISRNSLPPCLQRPCMVVGADVTHPSPDSTDIPSVAAVAASHSPNAFQYNMIIRLQDPRDEMIRDLQNIMKEQLLFFYRRTKYKPEKILFFRDGVSDGQIPQVFNIEFQAIRRACASLQPDYKPPITFVIVQKRHHTRFFPMDKNDCDDKRNYNVPAGTCVDTHIVHPRETDFYLVSHASIQGTARPTKYRLVWDDNDLGEVNLQNLTYYLCHLFSRCTRSVSYPAPTYNAHLAAFRGRAYLEGERINLNSLDREQRNIHPNIRNQSPMHFV